MLSHKKYRQTNKPHDMTWFEIEEKHMMEAYIQRRKDEKVMDTLEDIKKSAEYSCSDPRLHPRVREEVTQDFILESGIASEPFHKDCN